MKDSPMVAYGTWDITKHGEVVKTALSAEKQNIRDIIIIKNQRLMKIKEALAK